MQYMKVTAPLKVLERNLGFICVKWSTADEINHSMFGEELEHRDLKSGYLFRAESLSSIMRNAHIVTSDPAVHSFATEMP